MFLDTLFLSRVLPIPRVRTLPRSEGSHVVLHRLHGCSNAELIQLIFTIYDGIPEPFEVFYCQNLPTQNELDLFLERALRFPRQYIMLEVNKLPYHLQEVSNAIYIVTLWTQVLCAVPTAPSSHQWFAQVFRAWFLHPSHRKCSINVRRNAWSVGKRWRGKT